MPIWLHCETLLDLYLAGSKVAKIIAISVIYINYATKDGGGEEGVKTGPEYEWVQRVKG